MGNLIFDIHLDITIATRSGEHCSSEDQSPSPIQTTLHPAPEVTRPFTRTKVEIAGRDRAPRIAILA